MILRRRSFQSVYRSGRRGFSLCHALMLTLAWPGSVRCGPRARTGNHACGCGNHGTDGREHAGDRGHRRHRAGSVCQLPVVAGWHEGVGEQDRSGVLSVSLGTRGCNGKLKGSPSGCATCGWSIGRAGRRSSWPRPRFEWAWSPDSAAVAYVAPVSDSGIAGELYVFELAGTSARRIADADIVQSYDQPWWLNTNEIVFVADAHIWSVQPDGSDLRQVNELAPQSHHPRREPKELAAYNGRCARISQISANGQAHRLLRSQ